MGDIVIPSSVAFILKDIPWSLGYNHVRLFDDENEQQAFFIEHRKYVCQELYYIRTEQGHALKVPYNQYQLKECNYLMYQNENFGSKWFYAFITKIEYQSNGTSLIYFSEDVWQTWQFQLDLDDCFIVRQHTETDGVGQNTVPENLEIGPYITTNTVSIMGGSMHLFALLSEYNEDLDFPKVVAQVYPPKFIAGFPTSCFVVDFGNLTGDYSFAYNDYKDMLEKYNREGKADAIVAVFVAPSNWTTTGSTPFSSISAGANRVMANGYVPKNNKLYCYPYCCLAVVADGQSNELRYEEFENNPTFRIRSTFGPDTTILMSPINYGGYAEDYTHAVSLSGYPTLPWIKDYYQNWLAQHSASLHLSYNKASVDKQFAQAGQFANGIAGIASGIATGNVIGAIGSGVNSVLNYEKAGIDYQYAIANLDAKKTEQDIIPNSMVGSASAKNVKVVSGIQGFHTYCRCIKEEYLKICDDYFSMYGYAIHRIATPNLWSRRYWNYVKTVGAQAHGDMPLYASEAMEESLDRGITFWHIDDVANYSYDNSTGEHPVNPDPSPDIPDDPDDPTMPIFDREHNLCPIQKQYTITARFGEVITDASGNRVVHKGTDLACPTGTPIYSTNRGTVRYSGWASNGYGYRVIVETDGYLTLYAHMMEMPPVSVGDEVMQGELIGYVGATGNATGPHVHVGVCLDNGAWNWIDPNTYIPLY